MIIYIAAVFAATLLIVPIILVCLLMAKPLVID